MEKTYRTDDVTIIWKPDVCAHSTLCFKGLPEVFNPREKPWIKQFNASTEKLIEQINKCPSGALSYKLNNQNNTTMENETIKIQLAHNGPLLVNGSVIIVDKDGNETKRDGNTALCRCGHSKNKPFCDGAHRANNFQS